MKKELKRFVRFYMPGAFVAEQWTVDVNSADPMAVEWPENAYAFTLHEREDIVCENGARYIGETRQIGPCYYHPDSKVETLDEVKRNPNASSTLIANMVTNGYGRIVWSRWDNWPQPFDEDTCVVIPKETDNASEEAA